MKNIKVNSVEEFFSLNIKNREFFGFYLKPEALPWEQMIETEENGWDFFYKEIKKQYPIQYFLREWIFSLNNPVVSFFKKKIIWPIQELKYDLFNK